MAGIVLLSAGLDSTVALATFLQSDTVSLALTLDYGQRAASQEISHAQRISAHYGIKHRVITLPFLREITGTALVNREAEVPKLDTGDLDKVLEVTLGTAEKVWVPNRNGLLINIAASFAEAMDVNFVVTGFNAEEAATFPDNSPQFVIAANQSLAFSTLNQVKLISPTQNLNKMEIVHLGVELGIPWQELWSCYHGQQQMCGECESCMRLKRALIALGHTQYLKLLFSEAPKGQEV